MIYERLDLKFDVEKLREHLLRHVVPLKPMLQNKTFGGWSVWSSNGSHEDGYVDTSSCYKTVDGKAILDREKLRQMGSLPLGEYCKPTEICFGYLAEVMQRLADLELHPRRARINVLRGHGKTIWHRDGPDGAYAVRLHIPIITNEDCFYECDEGRVHFPADGAAYVIAVNRMHQVFNHGTEDRYHLIMNIIDAQGVTASHSFQHPWWVNPQPR
jgi:hypothetical protein